jgi:hypothetical protein
MAYRHTLSALDLDNPDRYNLDDKSVVTASLSSDAMSVTFNGDVQTTRLSHAKKLLGLFLRNRRDAVERDEVSADEIERDTLMTSHSFHCALWLLLRRYQTLCGYEKNEEREGEREREREGEGGKNKHLGLSFHCAAPPSLFAYLEDTLGVTVECFSSPFNCTLPHFYSAFPDTDGPFGSLGSFFDCDDLSGVCEVGPPYTVEVMDSAVSRCVTLLSKCHDPLSFIVFVPDWRFPYLQVIHVR